MRVLLTVHQFFPDHNTGTEVLTLQVASELSARGHEVRIITGYPLKSAPAEGRRFDRYCYQGLHVDRYFHHEGAPVGGQPNIAELEYDNHLVENWLRGLLSEWPPDVVHFFHLKNLSVSAIDVYREHGLPMVLTPTDFWLVCPTTQLLLPDGSLCRGPDRRGVNCLRHAIENTQTAYLRRVFALMPDSLLAGAIRACSTVVTGDVAPFSWVRALSQRGDFIRQRVSLLDQMFVPTRFMGHLFEANGLTAKQVTHSRFGIDLDGFRRGAVRRGTEPRLRIGFIGSLARWKVPTYSSTPSGGCRPPLMSMCRFSGTPASTRTTRTAWWSVRPGMHVSVSAGPSQTVASVRCCRPSMSLWCPRSGTRTRHW